MSQESVSSRFGSFEHAGIYTGVGIAAIGIGMLALCEYRSFRQSELPFYDYLQQRLHRQRLADVQPTGSVTAGIILNTRLAPTYAARIMTSPDVVTDAEPTAESDDMTDTSTMIRARRANRITAALVASSMLAIHPAFVAIYDRAEKSLTSGCPNIRPLNGSPEPPVQRAAIADMQFGMDLKTYLPLAGQLHDANSIAQVATIARPVFGRFGLDLFINRKEDPTAPGFFGSSLFTFGQVNESQRTDVRLPDAKIAVNSLLVALSQIPANFLRAVRGTSIYLLSDLRAEAGGSLPEGTRLGGEYISGISPYSQDGITVVAGADSGDIFKHELSHNLQDRLCGDMDDDTSGAVLSANPPGFVYTEDEKKKQQILKRNETVTAYAATNAQEDFAETSMMLLSGSYGPYYPGVIAQKERNITALLENIEPQLDDYYRYLHSVRGAAFPGDIANNDVYRTASGTPLVSPTDYTTCFANTLTVTHGDCLRP